VSSSEDYSYNGNYKVQQPTKWQERPSSKRNLNHSRPVSKTSNIGVDPQPKNSYYDVGAEGSIINIKRNTHGDPEMLILSSQKELKDLMST